MKNPKAQTGPQAAVRKGAGKSQVFSTRVMEGDVIRFDPTGEQLRVAKIAKGQITFEKLP